MTDLSHKDILIRLMDKVEQMESKQAHHHAFAETKLDNIDKHLAQLNSKVATHEQRLNKTDVFVGKAMMLGTLIFSGITFALNKFL